MGRTENRLRSPVPVQGKISLNICSGIWHCMVERCESPVAVSNPVPATAQMQLTEPQQDELERCARSRSVAARAVQRAKIILGLTAGETKKEIAQQLGIVRQTVRRWEQRFLQHGAEGLDDAPRSGRPPVLHPETIAQIVYKTTQETPSDSTHWSTRSLAQEIKVSASSVGRIWRADDLKPHPVRTFKLSNDRYFAEKTDDVVQLYLNPPPHSIVWSADEQCQIQALSRTQPGLTCAAGTIVRPRPTIISATERLLCSPRWMCSEARSCTCFGRNTVIRNGSNS